MGVGKKESQGRVPGTKIGPVSKKKKKSTHIPNPVWPYENLLQGRDHSILLGLFPRLHYRENK